MAVVVQPGTGSGGSDGGSGSTPPSGAALVSEERYRQLTHDTTTPQADVEQALWDAQELIEEELRRPLEQLERMEVVHVLGNRAYPGVTPIVAVDGDYTVEGNAVVGVSATGVFGDLEGPFSVNGPTTMELVYTGGYTAENLPVILQRAIAEVAYGLTRSAVSSSVPIGATSIRVGDVAIGYGKAGATSGALGDLIGESMRARIKRYRRRFI